MAMDEMGLPPPQSKGGKKKPDMTKDASTYGKLEQLAGAEDQGMGGGTEEQSAQLVMSGAQALMQAAQMNPALQGIVGQALSILHQGIRGMAGGGADQGMGAEAGIGEERPAPKKRKRVRPPSSESDQGDMDVGMGY